MKLLRNWFVRNFSDPQVVNLTVILLAIVLIAVFLGRIMAPIIASVIVAYLLNGIVQRLQRIGLPRGAAVWLIFLSFLAALLFTAIALLPILIGQTRQLIGQLPTMLARAHQELMNLPARHPDFVSPDQVDALIARVQSELLTISQRALAASVDWLSSIITTGIYLVLVPFLVFFFIRDQHRIAAWIEGFLPRERTLTTRVWREVAKQIDNYVRGKLLEIAIVGVAAYAVFVLFGLQYAVLLGALSGLSVLLPFVGAIAVAIPVAGVAYLQWGLGDEWVYVLAAYTAIQMIDGYVLNPLLMSEVVDLHPVAIIVAILLFGGLWGFWGVFFAVPLATIVKAVLEAWPRQGDSSVDEVVVVSKDAGRR